MIQSSPLTLVILISGNGSNLQAIIDAIHAQKLHATIKMVIADQPDAFGLIRAKEHHLPHQYLSAGKYIDRKAYDLALKKIIDDVAPDLIVLAGFMRILSKEFVNAYQGRMLNIHPSLLPKFPGLNTYANALKAGEKEHGTTIHFVSEAVDGGPIIAQARIPIHPEESIESLQSRVQKLEHQLYPLVLEWFASKRITVLNHSVYFDGVPLPKCGKQVNLY